MPEWLVYSRPGCCLCEEMIAELGALLGPAACHVRVVDVDVDPALQLKYGQRIPVLLADDEFVCAYHLDHARVRQLLLSADPAAHSP